MGKRAEAMADYLENVQWKLPEPTATSPSQPLATPLDADTGESRMHHGPEGPDQMSAKTGPLGPDQISQHSTTDVNRRPPLDIDIGDISFEELNEAIEALKPNKAPGPDSVVPELVKWLSPKHRITLL